MSLATLWATKDMDPPDDCAEVSGKSDFVPSLAR